MTNVILKCIIYPICKSLKFFAIFFDAKKTAAKETVAVENFINLHHRAGNDFKLITDY